MLLPSASIIPGDYIVVFKDSVERPGNLAEAQADRSDGELGFVYRHGLKGYSAELSKSAVEALRDDPQVKYVTPDVEGELSAQTIPTGVARIFAPGVQALDIDEQDDVRVNADVAVIDTGIDFAHPSPSASSDAPDYAGKAALPAKAPTNTDTEPTSG